LNQVNRWKKLLQQWEPRSLLEHYVVIAGSAMTWDNIITVMTLDAIATFDTIVAFIFLSSNNDISAQFL
jgi:hypothetical protein